jgi:pimeloyl-ACP methyl ester carboxylesterase
MADHSALGIEDTTLNVDKDLDLRLRVHRRRATDNKAPVLLLHGASAASQTFEFPRDSSFVDYLLRETPFEPWLLDWRCSKNVTEPYRLLHPFDDRFTYDEAACIDIPAALNYIRARYEKEPLHIVGHCMGAESLSRAIAYGKLRGRIRPNRIVLSTIGLFYEVAVDGRLKADDHLLERLGAQRRQDELQGKDNRNDFVDPTCDHDRELRNEWPDALVKMYDAWPGWLKPHGNRRRNNNGGDEHTPQHVLEMCDRVSFMFGEPYYEPALHPEIHESPTELAHQFGMMPLPMYVHAAQCVRRGWAAPYNASHTDHSLIDGQARKHFDGLPVLLITGAMNRLWHRDSVDRMYEWLKRSDPSDSQPSDRDSSYRKKIFMRNGHQDLFWGTNSWKDVFPEIGKWLAA